MNRREFHDHNKPIIEDERDVVGAEHEEALGPVCVKIGPAATFLAENPDAYESHLCVLCSAQHLNSTPGRPEK